MHSPALLARCEQKLASLRAERVPGDEYDWDLQRYTLPLLDAARAAGDWRRELTLLASIATMPRDWLRLCSICCDHDEPLEGEYWLAKARKLAVSPHEKSECDEIEIRLSIALGEKGRAWRLARAGFERMPHFDGFKRLRQLQHQLEWQDETLLPWAEQCFKDQAAVSQPFNLSSHQDALVRFYLDQERMLDACDWVATHKISPELLLTLADKIARTIRCWPSVIPFGLPPAMWRQVRTMAMSKLRRRCASGSNRLGMTRRCRRALASKSGRWRPNTNASATLSSW